MNSAEIDKCLQELSSWNPSRRGKAAESLKWFLINQHTGDIIERGLLDNPNVLKVMRALILSLRDRSFSVRWFASIGVNNIQVGIDSFKISIDENSNDRMSLGSLMTMSQMIGKYTSLRNGSGIIKA